MEVLCIRKYKKFVPLLLRFELTFILTSGNYVNASEKIASGEHWPCVLHTLQLVVNFVFEECSGDPQTLYRKVHSVVVAIKGSREKRELLKEQQALEAFKQLELVLDNATRWHSKLAMFER